MDNIEDEIIIISETDYNALSDDEVGQYLGDNYIKIRR